MNSDHYIRFSLPIMSCKSIFDDRIGPSVPSSVYTTCSKD